MFSIFTSSFLFFFFSKISFISTWPLFNTTIPTIQQTLMKTVARHFSAVTFLSRHFQNLKHILNTVRSQDLHIKNTKGKGEKNTYHEQSFHRKRFRQLFADILRHRTLHIAPFFPITKNFRFPFSLFTSFLCLFSSFSLSFVKETSLMTPLF